MSANQSSVHSDAGEARLWRIGAVSIGPTRALCLAKLRRHPAIAALTNAEATCAGRDSG